MYESDEWIGGSSLIPHLGGHVSRRVVSSYFLASSFMWQFLYFLPLPHGQGSLRPTFAPTLRIGSVFLASPPVFVVCSAASVSAWRDCKAEMAADWVARAPAHRAI